MFESKQELLEKIRLGEDSLLEFKETRFSGQRMTQPTRDSLADELAAFANSHGGVCVLGVNDETRDLVGIPADQLDVAEQYIRQICTDSIVPPVTPRVERLNLPNRTGEDRPVIRVDVPRSLFVHRSPGGYLHRVGSAKRVMTPEYLARLFQQRGQTRIIRFDEQVVPEARLDDLSPDLVARFATVRTNDDQSVLSSKLGLARTDDDGTLKPTVSGILMASDDPRRWIPNAYIQAVAYRGTSIRTDDPNGPYQLDAADISGPLDAQVIGGCEFVAKNMRIEAFKQLGRRDRPQFDMSAVFEAMVNAVAHRDYSIHGSKIRLRLFEDRLELYSPGTLPNTLGIEQIEHLQSSRNETLASLLAKCPVPNKPWLSTDRTYMMDKRGEGVPIILGNSLRQSGREPEYRLVGDAELQLTIFAPAR